MEIKEIKACPLLGCHEQENTVFEKALGIASTEIVLEAYECMGEKCINFGYRGEGYGLGKGYCEYFKAFTGHRKDDGA